MIRALRPVGRIHIKSFGGLETDGLVLPQTRSRGRRFAHPPSRKEGIMSPGEGNRIRRDPCMHLTDSSMNACEVSIIHLPRLTLCQRMVRKRPPCQLSHGDRSTCQGTASPPAIGKAAVEDHRRTRVVRSGQSIQPAQCQAGSLGTPVGIVRPKEKGFHHRKAMRFYHPYWVRRSFPILAKSASERKEIRTSTCGSKHSIGQLVEQPDDLADLLIDIGTA